MSRLVEPHGGGTLKPLLAPETERAEELKRAEGLKQVPMSSREVSDVLMLSQGAYTPLDGFMSEADWRGACVDMTLANGLFWPIPVTLSATQELADSIHDEEEVALVDAESGLHHGDHARHRKVQPRQGARVRARFPHHRDGAPGRREGHGPGRASTWPVR